MPRIKSALLVIRTFLTSHLVPNWLVILVAVFGFVIQLAAAKMQAEASSNTHLVKLGYAIANIAELRTAGSKKIWGTKLVISNKNITSAQNVGLKFNFPNKYIKVTNCELANNQKYPSLHFPINSGSASNCLGGNSIVFSEVKPDEMFIVELEFELDESLASELKNRYSTTPEVLPSRLFGFSTTCGNCEHLGIPVLDF